jgi:hypothetical protein
MSNSCGYSTWCILINIKNYGMSMKLKKDAKTPQRSLTSFLSRFSEIKIPKKIITIKKKL